MYFLVALAAAAWWSSQMWYFLVCKFYFWKQKKLFGWIFGRASQFNSEYFSLRNILHNKSLIIVRFWIAIVICSLLLDELISSKSFRLRCLITQARRTMESYEGVERALIYEKNIYGRRGKRTRKNEFLLCTKGIFMDCWRRAAPTNWIRIGKVIFASIGLLLLPNVWIINRSHRV